MAYNPPTGSTVAFQSDPTKLVGTFSVVGLPANQSVSGAVTVSNFPTTQAVGNSSVQVVGAMPPQSVSGVGVFDVNHIGNGSILTVPTANQSVSGAVSVSNLPLTQNVSGSVATYISGSTNASVITTGPANQSVSGAISVSNFPVNQNVSGSVVAFLGGSTNSSVITTGPTNQSVSGTVNVGNYPVNQNISGSVFAVGSVTTLQGTNPWKVELTSGSIATSGGNSSVQVVGIVPPSSVSGVGIFNIAGSVATTGSVTTLQGTNPWVVQTTGSVLTQYREDTVATSVIGYPLVFRRTDSASMMGIVSPANPLPIAGSVATLQGTNPWVISNPSVAVMSVVPHSVATLQGTNPWIVSNTSVAVMSVAPHSVATLQGTNPWVIGNSSVMLTQGTNTVGSVAVLQSTSPWLITGSVLAIMLDGSASIVGSYSEDIAHVTGDKGLFVMQVRNDAMTSVTTATGEYSQFASGPIGETLIANAPINKWITGFASITQGTDRVLIPAGGASVFTYITAAQLSMFPGAVNQVSFKNNAGGTIIHRMYLPSSTAGISMVFQNPLKTLANAPFIASISAIGSVMVNVQGFTSNFDV